MKSDKVWLVMTHGHRIDSIWTTEEPAQTRARALRLYCDNSPDWQVELWIVKTNVVLR